MQKLSRLERETHICINEAEEYAMIDTAVQKDITKCRKQGYEVVKENFYDDGTICNVIFRAPKRAISFRNLEKMVISEKQREAKRKQIQRLHEK